MGRPSTEIGRARKDALAKGLIHFFTGNPCIHGHICERMTSNFSCMECNNIQVRALYKANPAKSKARAKKYADEHRDDIKIRNKEYKTKHAERLRPINAARARIWFKENRERAVESRHARRALEKNIPGRHTAKELKELLEKQKYKCAFCFKGIRKKRHLDHVVPISSGMGSNDITNLQWLCPTCNLRKHDKDPIVWAQENGRLL